MNQGPYVAGAGATSIVLRGQFAPGLFAPAWFRSAALIGDSVDEIRSITNDAADFSVGDIDVFVTEDTLQLGSKAPEQALQLRDLAIGTLRALRGIRIAALGINRATHSSVEDLRAMHRIGDTLAPKRPWDDVLHSPGVRSIETWGVRDDGWKGRVGVVVEPSAYIQPGVYIGVNDHFALERETDPAIDRDFAFVGQEDVPEATTEKWEVALEILNSRWDEMLDRADRVHARIMDSVS